MQSTICSFDLAHLAHVELLTPKPDESGQLERCIIGGLLAKQPTTRDPNQTFEAQSTFGERVADKVALLGGSWTFIGLFFIGMASWMALNLVLSCVAALKAPVIMMSQNRQSAKDRSDAKNDYEVNVRAEILIMALHAKPDSPRDEELVRLTRLVEEQQRALDTLRHR